MSSLVVSLPHSIFYLRKKIVYTIVTYHWFLSEIFDLLDMDEWNFWESVSERERLSNSSLSS